jgi:hypothetical protein
LGIGADEQEEMAHRAGVGGLRRRERKRQIEGHFVARVHGAARPRHPLGVLRANIGVAFEVLVDHAEPDRQIYLLGPRFDERLALGIDRHEGLLGDHPAGRAAALLEPGQDISARRHGCIAGAARVGTLRGLVRLGQPG